MGTNEQYLAWCNAERGLPQGNHLRHGYFTSENVCIACLYNPYHTAELESPHDITFVVILNPTCFAFTFVRI